MRLYSYGAHLGDVCTWAAASLDFIPTPFVCRFEFMINVIASECAPRFRVCLSCDSPVTSKDGLGESLI